MPDKGKDRKPEEVETHLGHPITKCPPAYAEGAERGPTVKVRPKKQKSE
jgi:hypothetical protein